jgi:hypothetical protein
MLIAWNGRVVVLDRVVIMQGGGGHGLPVFVDVEFCTGPYGICGCRYYLAIEAHARSRCPGGVRNASSRITRSAKAVTGCPHERNRNPRTNERTRFRVRSFPLGGEK